MFQMWWCGPSQQSQTPFQPIVMIQRYFRFFSKNQICISLDSEEEIRKGKNVRVMISIIGGKVQTSTEGYVLSCGITSAIYHMKLDLAFKSFKLKNQKNTYTPLRLHTFTTYKPELSTHLSVYTPVPSHTCIQQETNKQSRTALLDSYWYCIYHSLLENDGNLWGCDINSMF